MKTHRHQTRLRVGLILALAGLICAAALLLSPARRASAQAAAPSWSNTGNLNSGRDSQTATLLQNGKVLVTGGNNSNGTIKNTELYDPTSGTWSTTGNLNTDRAFHTATLLPNGKVLVAGGFSCGPPPQTCADVSSAQRGTL